MRLTGQLREWPLDTSPDRLQRVRILSTVSVRGQGYQCSQIAELGRSPTPFDFTDQLSPSG